GALVISVPNTLRRALWISPVPPQVRHAIGAVPGWAPLPRHVSHTTRRSSWRSRRSPKAASRASARAAAPPGGAEPAETSRTEEHLEDLGEVAEPAAWTVGGAEGVVPGALGGVGQDLVGAGDLLEALLRSRIAVHVRVMLARELPIRAADVLLGRVAGDPQDLVEVADGGHHCSASPAASVKRRATARTAVIAER